MSNSPMVKNPRAFFLHFVPYWNVFSVSQEISALLCGFVAETGLTEEELEGGLDALLAEESEDVAAKMPDVPQEAMADTLPDVPEGGFFEFFVYL